MKPLTLLAAVSTLTVLSAAAVAAEPPKMDQNSSMSYALGYQLGRDLTGTEVRDDALLQGIKDGQAGAAARLNPEEMQAALTALQTRINDQQAKAQAEAAQKAAAAGAAFLADNARREGVKTTASGLQYKVTTPGTGGGVIAGWTEALQLMKEGAKYQLVIPPALAYGDRGPLAGQVLVFDVELLGVSAGAPTQ